MHFPSGMAPQIIANAQPVSSMLPLPTIEWKQLGNPIVDNFTALPVWAKVVMGLGALAAGAFVYSRVR